MTVRSDTDRPEIISPVPLRVCASYKLGWFSSCLPLGTSQSPADRLGCQLKAQESPVMQACTQNQTHAPTQRRLTQPCQLLQS